MNHSQMTNVGKKSAIKELGKIVRSYMGKSDTKKCTNLTSCEYIDATNGVAFELCHSKSLDGLSEETKALIERAENRKLVEDVRQQINIENIVGVAEATIGGKECTINEEVDDDFITRLFNVAKDANKREMQFIWGKILAQEIIEPGSFSLRTLEIVKNLGKKDTDIFEKILALVFKYNGTPFLIADGDFLKKHNVVYHDILLLEEFGLISPSGKVAFTLNLKPSSNEVCYTNEVLLLLSNNGNSEKNIKLNVYKFTISAIELLKIIDIKYNIKVIKDLEGFLKTDNRNIDVKMTIHKINYIDADGSISYDTTPLEFN